MFIGPYAVVPPTLIAAGIIDDILDAIFVSERAAADCLSAILNRVDQTIAAQQEKGVKRNRGRPRSKKRVAVLDDDEEEGEGGEVG